MAIPADITFHRMEHSDIIENHVRAQLDRLERFESHIISCRVSVEAPHKQQHKSTLGINVEVSVPGDMIVAKREARPHESFANDDAYGVIRDAFHVVMRQLDEYAAKRRRAVKTPAPSADPRSGRVARLLPDTQAGFIETPDGETLFFSSAIVPGDGYAQLKVGSEVRYVVADEEGAYGPQAKLVEPVAAASG